MSNALKTNGPNLTLAAIGDSGTRLTRLLTALADHLTDFGDSEQPVSRTDQASTWWADPDYIYLETDLTGPRDLEADISIHEKRVLIRIVRQAAG